MGIAQLKTGRLPESIASLQAALEQHPNGPDLLCYLGRASGLLSKNTFDTLQANFPEAARSHPSIAEPTPLCNERPKRKPSTTRR